MAEALMAEPLMTEPDMVLITVGALVLITVGALVGLEVGVTVGVMDGRGAGTGVAWRWRLFPTGRRPMPRTYVCFAVATSTLLISSKAPTIAWTTNLAMVDWQCLYTFFIVVGLVLRSGCFSCLSLLPSTNNRASSEQYVLNRATQHDAVSARNCHNNNTQLWE